MHKGHMDKSALIDEFFALRGTLDVQKLAGAKNKIVRYLQSNGSDAQLKDIITILELTISSVKYRDTKNLYYLMTPIANRLNAKDNWDIFDIMVAKIVVGHAEGGYKGVYKFAQKILTTLEEYKNENFYARARFVIRYNTIGRLIWSKFFELGCKNSSIEMEELTSIFIEYADFIMAHSNDPEYSPLPTFTRVRIAIFNQDYSAAEEALLLVEKEVEPHAYRTVTQWVNEYFSFIRSGMTRVLLNIKIGSNINSIRKTKKISREKLAKMLGENQGLIKKIEQGKQDVPLLVLHNIAYHLGVSYDELLN